MADPFAPRSIIVNSLASGEVSSGLYGRTDLAKFHQGAFVMRNFFVDYKGGASTRAGTQYMGQAASAGYVRLWPFKFSADIGQTYMLVFSDSKLSFIKNPGGSSYPNGSNAGLILSGGAPYTISTPYVQADLPKLKFSQSADVLTITHPGYARRKLARISDVNWTLSLIADTPPIAAPTIVSTSISAIPAGSTDPQNTRYIYAVSAVDVNGNESLSAPAITSNGIDIGVTQGSVSIFWNSVTGAAYYKVYKGLPSPGNFVPPLSQPLGFAGYSYGTSFIDGNVIPDFTKPPVTQNDPFAAGQISGYNITAGGSGYPVGATTLVITTDGSGAVLYPILSNNLSGGTGSITGIYIANPGFGATFATVAASGAGGSGFTATLSLSPSTGINPGVVGLFQQRQIYARTDNQPSTVFGSKPGTLNDFRTSNPVVDSDAIQLTISSQQVNEILWVQSMPGGLVIGTNAGVVQLTGGSASASSPAAVTPQSAVIVPQSYYGAADIHPIVIDYDILYVQSEGAIVRDLQYNFFVNIYTGTDVTVLSSQLFYPHTIVDWTYQDTPNKVIWAVREDGVLLSLTWLKAQEILGWAHHDTYGGFVESIAVVQEGNTDAVYMSVNRFGTRFIERLCGRVYNQVDDSWCLDAALSVVDAYPASAMSVSGATGNIIISAATAVFSGADLGKIVRAGTGKAIVTNVISTSQLNLTVTDGYPFDKLNYTSGTWHIDPIVGTISGLTHLEGFNNVYALVDGKVQGPFTVSGGAITLTTPGSAVVVGLPYTCQLQPVYSDIGGEMTMQGARKKVAAASLRVKDTARLKFGPDFAHLNEFVRGFSSTDPVEALPYVVPGLETGDQRMIINQDFNVIGSVAIEQDQPLPATVLAVIMEMAQGDTP